jgi:hypothetical protein
VKLWDGEMVEVLVQHRLDPQQLLLYRTAAPIQRADLARYLVILEHGGWYLDLDVGVDCIKSHQHHTERGQIARVCTNKVAVLEAAVGFDQQPTAIFFYERDPLTLAEQAETARRPCRGGEVEHAVRLANYGFWGAKGAVGLQRVVQLAFARLARLGASASAAGGASAGAAGGAGAGAGIYCAHPNQRTEQLGRQYTVLYSTGPDAVSEAVLVGSAREPPRRQHLLSEFSAVGGVAAQVPGIAQLLFPAVGEQQPPVYTAKGAPAGFQGMLGDGSVVMDPRNLLVNINAHSWTGTHNEALERVW